METRASEFRQEHIAQAYTFELGKCYEGNIKLRQLRSLANIDTRLCELVGRRPRRRTRRRMPAHVTI